MSDREPNVEATPDTKMDGGGFTVEVGLWMGIAIVALVLRLTLLGAAPLTGPEAGEAMAVWNTLEGRGGPEGGYSPALFSLNALTFVLFEASDWLARLWPAFFGSALALTPILFRRHLGRWGALAVGAWLAISPTALFTSRRLSGDVIGAVGVMVGLGAALRFVDERAWKWSTLSALGLALAVTSGPLAYGLLIALLLAVGVFVFLWPEAVLERGAALGDLGAKAFPAFVVGVLVLGAGFGINVRGLGVTGGLIVDWLGKLGWTQQPGLRPLTVIGSYEVLGLLLAVGGLIWAVRRKRRLGSLLGLWVAFGGLSLSLMSGRVPTDVLMITVPLAFLIGFAANALEGSLRRWRFSSAEGLIAGWVLLLWIFVYLLLMRYATNRDARALVLAITIVPVQLLLGLTRRFWMDTGPFLRDWGLATGIVLLGLTLSLGLGVAFDRSTDAREPLVHRPTDPQVRDLVATLEDRSWWQLGVPMENAFLLEAAPDSVLAWYLRDFGNARRVDELDLDTEFEELVTTQRALAVGERAYRGQDFVLTRTWDLNQVRCALSWPLHCEELVGWFLQRTSTGLPVSEEWAVLWVSAID